MPHLTQKRDASRNPHFSPTRNDIAQCLEYEAEQDSVKGACWSYAIIHERRDNQAVRRYCDFPGFFV